MHRYKHDSPKKAAKSGAAILASLLYPSHISADSGALAASERAG